MITSAQIEISQEKTKSARDRAIVQVTLNCDGRVLRGQERAADHFSATDAVADVLQRQARKHKTKLQRKGHRAVKAGESFAPEPTIEEEPPGTIVRTKRFPMKPMTADEAVDELELLGHGFFMFLNSETQEHNVVYRRKGGDYGLIEPDAL